MKNKYIKIFTVLCLVFSVMLIGIGNIKAQEDDFSEALALLTRLEITDAKEEDREITRAEAAAYAARLGRNVYHVGNYSSQNFRDVAQGQEYCDEINSLFMAGIVMGDNGYFRPTEHITAVEFMVILMRMAGYSSLAQFDGGYAAGYMQYCGDIFSGIDDINGSITYKEAMQMIYNILFEPALVSDGEESNTEVNFKDDKTVLEVFFDLTKSMGRVVADRYIALDGRSRTADNRAIIEDSLTKKDYSYIISEGMLDEYMGLTVNYYTDEEGSIFFLKPVNDSAKIISIKNRDITDADTGITEVFYLDGNKSRNIKVSPYANFVYNGTSSYDVSSKNLTDYDGYTEFIDTDNNSEYDIVKIWNFETYFVGHISVNSSRINDINTGKALELDRESGSYDLILEKYGKPASLNMIEKYDTISVARSNTDTGNMLVTAIVSDETVKGTLEAKSNDKVTIDGEEYDVAVGVDTEKIKVGVLGMYGISFLGEVVCWDNQSLQEVKYAYLLNAGKIDEGNERVQIRIIAHDSTVKRLMLAEKFILNNRAKVTADELISELSDVSDIKKQLISYKMNDEGEIKYLYTASDTAQGPVIQEGSYRMILNRTFEDFKIHTQLGVLDAEYQLTKNVPIFRIMIDENGEVIEGMSQIIAFNSLAAEVGHKINISLYDADEDRIPQAALTVMSVNDWTTYYKPNTHAILVDSFGKEIGEDNNEVSVVKGWVNGVYTDYVLIDELADDADIQHGDMLVTYISGNSINAYIPVFRYHCTDFSKSVMFGDYAYDGETPGYYDINDGYGKASSRSIVIGTIERISDTGLIIKPEGSEDLRRYIFSGNVGVYIMGDNGQRISSEAIDSVASSGERVMVYTRYGVVNDIIVIK